MRGRWAVALAAVAAVAAIVVIPRPDRPAGEDGVRPRFRYGFSNHYAGNRGQLFEDPRLEALRLTDYRVVVPFDIAYARDHAEPCRRTQWTRLRDSYRAALGRGMSVMVALERVSTCDGPDDRAERFLPGDREYLRAVRRLREQFPRIRWFAAWNEPNYPSQPTSGRPKRAARYLELLQEHVCTPASPCRTVGAELAVLRGWREYLDRYLASLRGVRLPTKWGIHPYDDVDRAVEGDTAPRRTGRTPDSLAFRRRIERLGPEHRVWITEVGSFLREQSEAQQAEEVRYIVDDLAPRLGAERVYYWSFWGRGKPSGFDTMLIELGPAGTDVPPPSTRFRARPSYDVYRCYRRTDAGC